MIKKMTTTRNGFTLIEILLSLSILAIFISVGIPIYQSLQNTNDLDVAENIALQSFRRAQSLSRAVDSDSTWGTKIQNGSVTIFKGASFSARATDFDEVFEISTLIIPTGVTEIVYSKFDGFPNTTGTLTLTSNNEVRTIVINQNGTLSY